MFIFSIFLVKITNIDFAKPEHKINTNGGSKFNRTEIVFVKLIRHNCSIKGGKHLTSGTSFLKL
jgi:hypothetical protein